MRVLLTTYGLRGDVEPLVGLAVQLRALGAEVPVCAPPDFAEPLARIGMPLVPVGQPVRPLVTGATPPSAADLPRARPSWSPRSSTRSPRRSREGDAPVATGVMPAGV
jgi:vancomycin aglycone glucosyltransferase